MFMRIVLTLSLATFSLAVPVAQTQDGDYSASIGVKFD